MPNRKFKVRFNFLERGSLSRRNDLKAFIEQVFKKEKTSLYELQYVFCSDDYLLNINRKFLDHDFYTDIITFDLSEGGGTRAEVYISLDRVKENASELRVPFKQELLRVIFHGVLHLCGYNDKISKDIRLMRQKEDHYIHKFNKFHVKS